MKIKLVCATLLTIALMVHKNAYAADKNKSKIDRCLAASGTGKWHEMGCNRTIEGHFARRAAERKAEAHAVDKILRDLSVIAKSLPSDHTGARTATSTQAPSTSGHHERYNPGSSSSSTSGGQEMNLVGGNWVRYNRRTDSGKR